MGAEMSVVRLSFRVLLCAGVALMLAGCLSDQNKAATACARGRADQNAAIISCMSASGYVANFGAMYCGGMAAPARQGFCYRPRNSFAASAFWIESLFETPPSPKD